MHWAIAARDRGLGRLSRYRCSTASKVSENTEEDDVTARINASFDDLRARQLGGPRRRPSLRARPRTKSPVRTATVLTAFGSARDRRVELQTGGAPPAGSDCRVHSSMRP
jgi:hypothetical protein